MIENNDLLLKVCNIAIKAGEEILKYYNDDIEVTHKDDSSPLTKADLASNKIILNALHELDRTIPILSEESLVEWNQRKNWTKYWLVDPLDGTKEFIEGIPHFSISIALVKDGSPVIGIIYNPYTEEMFYAEKDKGAYLNGSNVKISVKEKLIDSSIVVSRSEYRKKLWNEYKESFSAIESIGSVAYKLGLVSANKYDIFSTVAPKNEWDICAGDCIIREAGGVFKTINDKNIIYNQKKTLVTDPIIATNSILFNSVSDLLY